MARPAQSARRYGHEDFAILRKAARFPGRSGWNGLGRIRCIELPKQRRSLPLSLSIFSMSQGVPGAGRDYGRRRRWLAQLPEEATPPPVQRERSTPTKAPQAAAPEPVTPEVRPVSSLLPRSPWILALFIAGALLSWAAIVGGGAWLDAQHLEPWQGIFGLQAGRLLRFYTTVSLLACAQLSYLILWRRSRSRKDFAGRYRVWFWIGAVCSIFCVATVTRFHEAWAYRVTAGLHAAWIDAPVLCWMVPATTMLITAVHLLRRDLPARSASIRWIQAGRGLAVFSGITTLLGSLFLPTHWVAPVQGALGALWPTVLGCGLLTYARYVTYVTNEAGLEKSSVRKSRWMTRVVEFATQVQEMAQEEWQVYRARREQAKATTAPASSDSAASTKTEAPAPTPVRPATRSQSLERTTAPLRKLQAQAIAANDEDDEDSSVPVTRAANIRPRSPAPSDESDEEPAAPAAAIPSPHFTVRAESSTSQSENDAESERSISRKERKKARRA